jgi:hypothetical protein
MPVVQEPGAGTLWGRRSLRSSTCTGTVYTSRQVPGSRPTRAPKKRKYMENDDNKNNTLVDVVSFVLLNKIDKVIYHKGKLFSTVPCKVVLFLGKLQTKKGNNNDEDTVPPLSTVGLYRENTFVQEFIFTKRTNKQ